MSIQIPARLEDVEKHLLLMTLIHTNWNKYDTAHHLGLSVKAVYNWIHKYRLPMHRPPGARMLDAIAQAVGTASQSVP